MAISDISSILSQNDYPGRGIIAGRSGDGKKAVLLYFIMGRSVNSRNRIFAETEDGIRTMAFDESKLTDPSLVIYHPVRRLDGRTIVTNGDQTDTIRDFLEKGKTFRDALLTREFEPDGPNFTPRISALMEKDGRFAMSILKSENGDSSCCCRYFYEYDNPLPGQGKFIHTYKCDGTPLPSFEGEPVTVGISGDIRAYAEKVWNALNYDNKVSLFACSIEIESGKTESVIFNKNS